MMWITQLPNPQIHANCKDQDKFTIIVSLPRYLLICERTGGPEVVWLTEYRKFTLTISGPKLREVAIQMAHCAQLKKT